MVIRDSRTSSRHWHVACLLSVYIWALVFTGINADAFKKWRGLSKLEDLDMVEVATWIEGLADNVTDGVRYYWVNNELFYPYAATVRSLFGIFNQQFIAKNISSSFMEGCEALIHYMIMKSFPIEGRKGGIRGNGQDRQTLRAAVAPLRLCFEKPKADFATLFPAKRRRKKRRAYSTEFFSKIKQGFKKLKSRKWYSASRVSEEEVTSKSKYKSDEKDSRSESDEVGGLQKLNPFHKLFVSPKGSSDENSPHNVRRRYSYTMYHGKQAADNTKKTIIVMPDKDIGVENIATSVFWLIYEVVTHNCDFTKEQIDVVMKGVDGIIGLVLSLYMYDPADYAEEYERIFKLPVLQFEMEWTKVENIARTLSKQRNFTIRKPYTSGD